ncbi:MAG: hypothetical protein OQK25_01120 [Gammaproteobacteria bacterium]|nr:hypothetical protein [Gammaproteobacteria bacterium]
MNLQESYFSFSAAYNPLPLFDRWLNPAKLSNSIIIRGHAVAINITRRAENQLALRTAPLIVEMQIYFSCVVKKRVLFHESSELETTEVNDRMQVGFRAVQSNSCDPVEFANNFPIKQPIETEGATKMHPKSLTLDYKHGQWIGEFTI